MKPKLQKEVYEVGKQEFNLRIQKGLNSLPRAQPTLMASAFPVSQLKI